MVDRRTCSGCGESKPLDQFRKKWGARCGQCVADYQRAYYQANKARIRAAANEYGKKYYLENRDRIREWHRQHREANRDDILAKKRAYYVENRALLLAQSKSRYAANTARYRENLRAWRAANPDKLREHGRARRARRLGAQGSHTEEDWQKMLRIWNWSCAYCGGRDRLTRDHVVPLSRGGSDFIGNIVPACINCNSSKNAKFVIEWMAAR